MLGITAPQTAFAQGQEVAAQTCRTALEGSNFVEVDEASAPLCCYVTEEQPWYDEHNVVLHQSYRRDDDRVYFTETCDDVDPEATGSIASPGGPGGGGPSGGPGGGTTPPSGVTDPPAGGPDNGGPDKGGPDNEGPDNEGPDNEGPDNEGPDGPGNPGNAKDVGNAGEAPNGDADGFNAPPGGPGTKGQSDSRSK